MMMRTTYAISVIFMLMKFPVAVMMERVMESMILDIIDEMIL